MEQTGLEAIWQDAGFNAGLDAYSEGINKAQSVTEQGASVMGRMSAIASGVLTVGLGIATAAFGAFAAASKIGLDATMEWGEQVDKLTHLFGMSGEAASQYALFFSHFGVPVEEASAQLNYFTRMLDNANKATKDGKPATDAFSIALTKLGLSTKDAHGNLKTIDVLFPELLDKFSGMKEGVEKSALAMDLFGARGGSKFADVLTADSKALADTLQRSKALGLYMSTEQVDAVEKFGFSLNDLKDGMTGLKNQTGLAVLPIAQQFVDHINNKVLPAMVAWAKDVGPKVTAFLSDLAAKLGPVIQGFADLATQIAQSGLQALADLGKVITDAWSQIIPIFQPVADMLGQLLSEVGTKLVEFSTLWTTKIWPGIASVLSAAWDIIIKPALEGLSLVIQGVIMALENLGRIWNEEIWPRMGPVLKAIWDGVIYPILQALGDILRQNTENLRTLANIWLTEVWPRIAAALQAAWDIIGPILQEIFDTLGKLWAEISPKIVAAMNAIWEELQRVWEWMKPFIEMMVEFVMAIFARLQQFMDQHGQQIVKIIKGAWDIIYGYLEIILGAIIGLIEITLDIISGDWQAAGDDLMRMTERQMDGTSKIFGGGAAVISNIIGILGDEIINSMTRSLGIWRKSWEDMLGGLITWLQSIPAQMAEIGRSIVQGLIDGVLGMGGALSSAFQNIVQSAVNATESILRMGSPSKVFMEIGKNMALGLIEGFEIPELAFSPIIKKSMESQVYQAASLPSVSSYASAGGSSVNSQKITNNYFNLTTNSLASASDLSSDFGIMRALATG